MASEFVFAPPATVSVPVAGQPARFPVHRIYCVGRNYEITPRKWASPAASRPSSS